MNTIDNSKSQLRELVKMGKRDKIAIGYQKLTVAGTAVSLTIPSGATYAEIILESDVASGIAIRYLEHGSIPTTTDGMAKLPLDIWDVHGAQNLSNFKAIQAQAGTHTLHIQYYK